MTNEQAPVMVVTCAICNHRESDHRADGCSGIMGFCDSPKNNFLRCKKFVLGKTMTARAYSGYVEEIVYPSKYRYKGD